MSPTPPKEDSVEQQSAPSPDAQEAQMQGVGYEFEVKEQDRWLPIANVARIMKTSLPDNAKIAKEAKECMQECVSEFISFITSEASEKCQQEKRKTVNGEDILFAMTSLGFENYSEALKIYLSRYRETLLASQNKPAAGGSYVGGANGSNTNTGATGEGAAQHPNTMNANPEVADNDNTAFGYTVQNGGAEF
ncbi:hypothetical protein DM02DRAFT_608114 [Periconia macrospinosa]|uniref:Transcription factor CBF/NF-Y/archaeal histone domain-containing protein n=1 Tax=Periconia macrospinosa TaxID=97972 RepID=A0A2V1EEY9_9PLEO|nr:hypothetical protein DM02DRAFT_608114 [Periconia macrospinosa]